MSGRRAESWEKETTEYLLGVDYKRTPKTDTKFRNHYQYQSLQNEQTKFVKSVVQNTKLLRNIKELKPQKPGCLVQYKVECDPSGIRFSLESPLSHFDLQKRNCEDLIKEIPRGDGNDEEFAKLCSLKQSKVLATELKWKNGVSVKHTTGKGYRSVAKEVNPTTTAFFDFESKTKFQKNIVPKIITEYFTGEDITILDGNNCHGQTSTNTSRAPKGQRETEVLIYLNSAYCNQNTDNHSTVSEYFDNDEHKLLLVPFYDKKGLDTDVNKRYIFPYCAKFNVTAGKESLQLQHTFLLQLALSQTPQHYGLVFTFPLSQNHVLLIKSLISVYSIFPESGQQCSITTYDLECTTPKYKPKAAKHGSLMVNFASFIESNLKKDLFQNLYPQGIQMTCDIANSQKFYGRIYQFAHKRKYALDAKHKNKQELLKEVQHENTLAQNEKDFALNNMYYCRCTCYGCRDDTVKTIYR